MISCLTQYPLLEYTIKDSFSFTKEIEDYVMTILYIKSLFTNIPLTETIGLCVENVYRKQTRFNNQTQCLNDFLSLIERFIDNAIEPHWLMPSCDYFR